MRPLTEIFALLRLPGLDMFEQLRHKEEILNRGAPVARDLLHLLPDDPSLVEGLLRDILRKLADGPLRERMRNDLEEHIAPNHSDTVRHVCMKLLANSFPEASDVGARLLDFALNSQGEKSALRLKALVEFGHIKPTATLGARLCELLRDEDSRMVLEAVRILPKYYGIVDSLRVEKVLWDLVGPGSEVDIRCMSIELLGLFGEMDALERVFLLPLRDEKEQDAVKRMATQLMRKPRKVLRLNPKNFEDLVRRLLEQMKYAFVKVSEKGSWDGGVDVTAFLYEERVKGREQVKVVVQCKRYQPLNLVVEKVVEDMVKSLKEQQASRGVIITTSEFDSAARRMAEQHRHIELIGGKELQKLLDMHFGENLYRVAD